MCTGGSQKCIDGSHGVKYSTSLGIFFYMQILTDKNWLILFSLIIAFSFNYMLGLARPIMAINIVCRYERNVATLLNESI